MAGVERQHFLRDELIGEKAWRKLVARYGGGDYRVPSRLDSARGMELCEMIGIDAAVKLVGYAKDAMIYVHAGQSEILAARYVEIRAMRTRGMTLAEIAAHTWPMRYTERSIREILNGPRGGEVLPSVIEDTAS